MWNETNMDDQYAPDHLLNHMSTRQKNVENGDYPHHSHDSLVDPVPHHNHLLRHDMLTDAMLGHVDARDRDQVK